MTVDELINAAKKGGSFGSDYALSQALNVSRSAVSEWRQGKRHPDPVNCEKLAVFSGFPLHQVLGIVGEARAISTAEKRVWRKLAAAMFVGLLVTFPAHAGSISPTNGHADSAVERCIMRNSMQARPAVLWLWLRARLVPDAVGCAVPLREPVPALPIYTNATASAERKAAVKNIASRILDIQSQDIPTGTEVS